MNNSDAIIGWLGLTFALVLGYAAYKDKSVFGSSGVVTTALTTGKIGTQVPANLPANETTPPPGGTIPTGPYAGSSVQIPPGTPAGVYTSPVMAQRARNAAMAAAAPSQSQAPAAPSGTSMYLGIPALTSGLSEAKKILGWLGL